MIGDLVRARWWHTRAATLWTQARHHDACAAQDRAVGLCVRNRSRTIGHRLELAAMREARALQAAELADHEGTVAVAAEAVRDLAGDDSRLVRARAVALIQLGHAERLLGRHDDALVHLVLVDELACPDVVVRIAAANAFGVLAKDTGRLDEAQSHYRRALAALPDGGTRHPDLLATLLHNLAGLAHARGDLASGEAPARRAVAVRRAIPGVDECAIAADETVLGAILAGTGRANEAETYFRRGIELWTTRFGPDHYEVAVNKHNLAEIAHRRGDRASTAQLLRDVLAAKQALLGRHHPEVLRARANLDTVEHDATRCGARPCGDDRSRRQGVDDGRGGSISPDRLESHVVEVGGGELFETDTASVGAPAGRVRPCCPKAAPDPVPRVRDPPDRERERRTPARSLPVGPARAVAAAGEWAWRRLPLPGRPPLTRMALWLSSLECTIDIGRARTELGYRPVVDRDRGLATLRDASR